MDQEDLQENPEDDPDANDEERKSAQNKEEDENAENDDNAENPNLKKEDLVGEDALKKFMKDLQIVDQNADAGDDPEKKEDSTPPPEENHGDALVKQVEIVKDKKLASFVTNAPGKKPQKNTDDPDQDDKPLDRNDEFDNMNMPQVQEDTFSNPESNSDQNPEEKEDPFVQNEDDLTKKRDYDEMMDQKEQDDRAQESGDSDSDKESNGGDQGLDRQERMDAEDGPVKRLKGESEDEGLSEDGGAEFNYRVDFGELGHLLQDQPVVGLGKAEVDLWKKYENELRDQAYS